MLHTIYSTIIHDLDFLDYIWILLLLPTQFNIMEEQTTTYTRYIYS